MTLVSDIRKTITDTTPVYAAVGVTDLAVEKVREVRAVATAAAAEASARAVAARSSLDVSALQGEAVKRAEKVSEQAQHLPAFALNQTLEVAGKAQETYAELAARGEKLVKRLRTQKATQDLLAQAGSSVSLGKGAVTTVRKAAVDTQRAAKATLTTGRREAGSVVETVSKSVKGEAKTTAATVRKSAAATRTSAKRTATTAKKSTASAQRATKSAATAATNTASAAAAAVETATPKIGD